MKILLIHQFFISESEPGGSRHMEFLRHWSQGGYPVRVIAGSVNYMTNRSKLPFGRFWKNEIVFGIPVTWVYAFPTLHLGSIGRIFAYVSFLFFAFPIALSQPADIIIVTSPPPTAALLGWFASRLKKIPWIFEVRDLWPSSAAEMKLFSKIFWYKFLGWLCRFLYKKASSLVTLTRGIEQELRKAGVALERIVTIPNGVDEMFLAPGEHSFPEIQALRDQGKFVVMYVGALGIANQVTRVLRLAGELQTESRFHFVIAGDGRQKESLKAFARKRGLSNVLFLGAVPRNRVPSLLRLADAGIAVLADVSAFRNAVPNKLFDYMASGIPVVLVFQDGEAWRILKNAKGGVRVDPDDFASMKKWLNYFLENPVEAKRTGRQGKAYALNHFLRKDLARRYLQLLKHATRPAGLNSS